MWQRGGAQPKPRQPGGVPLLQHIGQLLGSADENVGIAAIFDTGEIIKSTSPRLRCLQGVIEEHHQVTEDVYRLSASTAGTLQRPDLADNVVCLRGVVWGNESDVGAAGDQLVGHSAVAQGRDYRLALRRTRRNRGPFDGKPASPEVDVVQLVPVDEPSSGDIADLSVVLPALST